MRPAQRALWAGRHLRSPRRIHGGPGCPHRAIARGDHRRPPRIRRRGRRAATIVPSVTVTAAPGTAPLDAARSRALRTLFAGVGLGSTGYIAASTVSAIVATEVAGASTRRGG